MAILSEAALQPRDSLNGMTLDTRGGSYIFRKVLYHRPDRCVVKAQRTDASRNVHAPSLVVKLSLRSTARTSEEELVNKARAVAIDAGGDSHWVLRHLPRIIHSEELPIIPGSMQARIAEMLRDASSLSSKTREEDSVGALRIVVMEELLPIDTLTSASDFAQVFFDVLNCHKWLHDIPRILHRDISMSNIMYRFGDDGAVYGVLNDMDLSSPVADLEQQKATSSMRTGTPPFMAVDLLGSHVSEPVHLYRHDLESLFYVMLILSTHHRISYDGRSRVSKLVERVALPFDEWFQSSLTWRHLSAAKELFILKGFPRADSTMSLDKLFPPDSTFVDFGQWILRLKIILNRGFRVRIEYHNQLEEAQVFGREFDAKAVDEETLGEKIQYSTFFDVMKSFAGKDLRAPPVDLDTL